MTFRKPPEKGEGVAHFMQYPADYPRTMMGVQPTPEQVAVALDIAKPNSRTLMVGANGVGKDALSSWLPEWFMYCFGGDSEEPAVVPTTSASGRQVRILWREINNWSGQSLVRSAFEILQQKMYLAKNPRHYSEGFKASQEATIEGYHAPKMLYIMTEGRGAPDWAYTAMSKACTGRDNRIFVQSVPGLEEGEFFRIASGMRTGWRVHNVPAAKRVNDCHRCGLKFEGSEVWCRKCGAGRYVACTRLVTQESIDEKLRYGEESAWFVGPVLAQFSKASSLSLITLGQFVDAVNRYDELDDAAALDILGVDLAWVGKNETVLCHRRGPRIKNFIAYQGERTDHSISLIKQWMERHPHGIVAIEHGIAQSAVIDSLYADKLDDRVIEVNPGAPAFEPDKFFNRRSELYYYLAERFKNGTIGIPEQHRHGQLGGQLTSIRKKIRGDLIFQMESKAEMAARGIPSPDWADAAMLTMAASSEEGVEEGREIDLFSSGERARPDW